MSDGLIDRLVERWKDGGEIDGFELQDWLVEAGVLEAVEVSAPCGDDCGCAEYHGSDPKDWPVTCYRRKGGGV